jgi:monothiol glutaredoxin
MARMSDAAHDRIRTLISAEPVVLFMKGTRAQPQCGFSSRVVDVLDDLLESYLTFDILSDTQLREGLKSFSDWPTFPQLYVDGKFVGGADITIELHKEGELQRLLQKAAPDAGKKPEVMPEVHLTESALRAFRQYSDMERPTVRMEIARDFDVTLDISDPQAGDIALDLGNLLLSMDKRSASRANGMTIDFVTKVNAAGESEDGFKIDNPNKPAQVKPLSVHDYKAMRDSGKPHLLLDVRTQGERDTAMIQGSELLDDDMMERLMELDRATTIVCQCHHGVRSRNAAHQLVAIGFRDVWNLTGGIDAWSDLDPSVPKY